MFNSGINKKQPFQGSNMIELTQKSLQVVNGGNTSGMLAGTIVGGVAYIGYQGLHSLPLIGVEIFVFSGTGCMIGDVLTSGFEKMLSN